MRLTAETTSDGGTERCLTVGVVPSVLQRDDELVPRDSALALFDAFAAGERTLHANPGRHAGVPVFEVDSSARFFARHLLGSGSGS